MWYRCVQCRFVFELIDYLPGAAGVYIVVSYLNEAIYLPDAAGLYIAASFLNEAITYRTQPVFYIAKGRICEDSSRSRCGPAGVLLS